MNKEKEETKEDFKKKFKIICEKIEHNEIKQLNLTPGFFLILK